MEWFILWLTGGYIGNAMLMAEMVEANKLFMDAYEEELSKAIDKHNENVENPDAELKYELKEDMHSLYRNYMDEIAFVGIMSWVVTIPLLVQSFHLRIWPIYRLRWPLEAVAALKDELSGE